MEVWIEEKRGKRLPATFAAWALLLLGLALAVPPPNPPAAQTPQPPPARAPEPPPLQVPEPPIRPAPCADRFTLDNGLRVFLRRIEGVSTTSIVLLFDVGRRDDPVGKPETVHFLEHLMARCGTAHRPPSNPGRVAKGGPPWVSGWTFPDHMYLYKTFRTDALAAELQDAADRLDDLRIDPESFHAEMDAVARQVSDRNGFDDLQWDSASGNSTEPSVVERENMYCIERLRSIVPDWMRERFAEWIGPRSARLAVAGAIDVKKARDVIEREFGRVPASNPSWQPPRRALYLWGKPKPGFLVQERKVKEWDHGKVSLAFPAPRPNDPLYTPFLVLAARLRPPPGTSGLPDLDLDLLSPGRWLFLKEDIDRDEWPEETYSRLVQFVESRVAAPLKEYDIEMAADLVSDQFSMNDWHARREPNPVTRAAYADARLDQIGIDAEVVRKSLPTVTTDSLCTAAVRFFVPMVRNGVALAPASVVERLSLSNGLRVSMEPCLSEDASGSKKGAAFALHYAVGDDSDPPGSPGQVRLCAGLIGAGAPAQSVRALGDVHRRHTTFGWIGTSGNLAAAIRAQAERLRSLRPTDEEVQARVETLSRNRPQGPATVADRILGEAVRAIRARAREGSSQSTGPAQDAYALKKVRRTLAYDFGLSNARLAVVGEYDSEEIRRVVEEAFDGRPAGASNPATVPPPLEEDLFPLPEDPDEPVGTGRFQVAAWPAPRPEVSVEYASYLVLATRLGLTRLRTGPSPAGRPFVLYRPLEEPGTFALVVPPDEGPLDEKRVHELVRKAVDKPNTDRDARFTRFLMTESLGTDPYDRLSPWRSAQRLYGRAVNLARREQMGLDGEHLGRMFLKVTEESVRKAAMQWFGPPPVRFEFRAE